MIVGNLSVVILGDPAFAPAGGTNVNATHQACQISSSQLLHLIVYGGVPNTTPEVDQYLSIVGSNFTNRFNF